MKQEDIDAIAQDIVDSIEGKSYPAEYCEQLMREECLTILDAIKAKVLKLCDRIEYNTAHDLQLRICEDAMAKSSPAEISAETKRLLDKIEPDIFTVHTYAKELVETIADEHRRQEGDMVSVVQTLGAVLAPLSDWLKGRGVILVKP
jgi:hypothetical protein